MSEKSLNKLDCLSRKFTKTGGGKGHKRTYQWRMLMMFPAWVALAFVVANVLVASVLKIVIFFGVPVESYFRPAILQAIIAVCIYILTIGIVIGVPSFLHRKLTTSLETLGLQRLVNWTDIAIAPVTFIVYTLTITAVLGVIVSIFPSFPIDQTQDIGFKAFGSQADNIVAFMTLVVIAPIAEETLFRGYLYGKLKRYVPAFVAALVTSILFGLAHFQLNVGIDVFILSMFLCGLRSLTGSIWAGILVHMIKNGIAYYILFVSPLMGG